MRRSNYYQIALIFLGAIATAFFGIFVYREFYPEYRLFQNNYIALEQFRSTYTHKPATVLLPGVRQILIETPNNGPPIIDRCTSCHVALDIPYFSPTKLAYDVNGKIILDEKGIPVKIPNEEYIWGKLDQRIAELIDPKVNEQLKSQGELSTVTARLQEAEHLKSLKTVQIGDQVYDVTRALSMHPLMGRETRPFEYHSVANYGCTSCHSGNGRALTVDKAHGPIFDGRYDIEYRGPEPKFLETDEKNDPQIAHVFNHKPGDELVFQTTPVLVGNLIQAKCMQCHQTGEQSIIGALSKTQNVSGGTAKVIDAISESYENAKHSLESLWLLKEQIHQQGFSKTVTSMQQQLDNYLVPPENRKELEAQLQFLMQIADKNTNEQKNIKTAQQKIDEQILQLMGSPLLTKQLEEQLKKPKVNVNETIEKFVRDNAANPQAKGSLFAAANSLELEQALFHHVRDTETSFSKAVNDQRLIGAIQTDVDRLTETYQRGQALYISQGCYACHRISGFARGGVGPELTNIGKTYPWYIKHHIVWPQGDLPTSTMPNVRLDHAELEPLMAFLLAQQGQSESMAKTEYKRRLTEWEEGKAQSWEKPITPAQMYDLRYAMTVFATEGCASCHRLRGFESDVGYRIEKEKKGKVDFETLYREREWFTNLFPEELLGSQIVEVLDKHAHEIDQHIIDDVRKGSILEEIDAKNPEDIESFYTNFRFASRAKNYHYAELAEKEKDPAKKKQILDQLEEYKKRLHRVLMVYVQEYGLGRIIGPRPNWSGIYRSDAWLMEHFHKPSARIARSIMPSFPFDDTKFYALTHMLNVLSKRNRDWERQLWEIRGFNPSLAFQTLCSQCHGEYLGGNGPVSIWIYPIPKNLRNAEFLRNYTKARVINSITHGVKGTPMPPWGEVAEKPTNKDGIPVLTKVEIEQLAEWIFSTLPGSTVIQQPQDVPKWNYQPEDVIKEMKKEGNQLKGNASSSIESPLGILKKILPDGHEYTASLAPAASIPAEKKADSVQEFFDEVANPPGSPDKYSYYIKHKYYTENNIDAGRSFFELNCAVCHGAEADGMGARAAVMQEAKPRMLTNLDWLDTHDDLYLLRSIKYGVPGTSMVAWGDQTNALLRNQLVIYIRSLSSDLKMLQQLEDALYHSFDAADYQIDAARVQEVERINLNQSALQEAQDTQHQLYKEAQKNPTLQKDVLTAYQKQLELSEKLESEKQVDDILVQLKNLIAKDEKIYKDLGSTLLASKIDGPIWKSFLQMIDLLNGRYTFQDGKLQMRQDPAYEQTTQGIKNKITAEIDQRMSSLKMNQTLTNAKIHSAEQENELKDIASQLKTLTDFKDLLETSFQEAASLQKQQIDLVKKIQENEQQTQK
jgi:mono/diheme cytochrome c family protein